jgi:hypothetical protein
MTGLADTTQTFLAHSAAAALSFWCETGSGARPDVLAACDTLYCLKLIGRMDLVVPDAPTSASRFIVPSA